MRVLIVGAAGRLGRVLTAELGGEHDLLLGDVRPVDDPRYVPLDVRDASQVRAAVANADAVIHLAIVDSENFGGDTLEYAQAALEVHVIGAHHVLRAAADLGRKRVLYASTVSAVAGYPPDVMVGSDDGPRGGGTYGVTKGLGEELCRHFHEGRGLPVVVLRLGNVYFADPTWNRHGSHPSRVDASDVAQAFARVLRTPEPPFALVHIVGNNGHHGWDREAARRLYGWEPRQRFGTDGAPLRD